jgi:hypothetical protein
MYPGSEFRPRKPERTLSQGPSLKDGGRAKRIDNEIARTVSVGHVWSTASPGPSPRNSGNCTREETTPSPPPICGTAFETPKMGNQFSDLGGSG